MSNQPTAVNTDAAPAPVGPYNQAVRAGHVLYCSGQIALDPASGAMVGAGDVEAETHQVLRNLQAVLKAAGTGPQGVVRTTVFLVDLADFARVNAIYAEVFGARDPKTGACGSVLNLFANAQLNHHAEVVGGVLADECGTMLSDFFAERRQQSRIEHS